MLQALVLWLICTPVLPLSAAHSTTPAGVQKSSDPAASEDSLSITAIFTATGGNVTATGAFTAGAKPGTYRIVAVSGSLADTSSVIVAGPPAKPEQRPAALAASGKSRVGIPFGPFAGWAGSRPKAEMEPFTLVVGSDRANAIIDRIRTARSRDLTLVTNMTGGAHENYMTDGVFDILKWEARMNTYNSPAIRVAVAEAVADGTIVGNSVMDEPHVHGAGDGNTWGPRGTMTKERVDSMCGYAKTIFPTLPIGVVHQHRVFEPAKSYRVCDFIVSQYATRLGSVTAFRDAGLVYARRDGIAIAFSMNILNGGIQAPRNGLWHCPLTTTGGRGTYAPNCRMTAAQIREYGITLGLAGCAMLVWRYDDEFMANPENRQAFEDVAAKLASSPRPSCRRP